MPVDASDFAAALRSYATGVALMTVRDDIDDIGTTVTSVMSVSTAPPLVAVGLAAQGYPREVLESVGWCALSVLAAGQAMVASRFSSAGRPSARHLLQDEPWRRAEHSEAIVVAGALTALDCRLESVVPAGDHVVVLLSVQAVPVLGAGDPLLRFRGRWAGGGAQPLRRP